MSATKIIDGDGHVIEDMAAISKFIPAPYNKGTINPGSLFPPLDHLHGHNQVTTSARLSGRKREIGPVDWLSFLEEIGIFQSVLYPTKALAYGRIVSVDWSIAITRAYNDWLYENYVGWDPKFKGMALIPGQDPNAAVAELNRAVTELGFMGAMLPAQGYDNHTGTQFYWPIYEEADRLGCSIAFHGGCHGGLGMDRMNRYAPVHAMGHPISVMISFASVIFNGVMDRYPNVNYAFLEGGVAWTMMALERFDRSHETHPEFDPYSQWGPQNDEKVSDYIQKHIDEGRLFFGIEGDEPLLATAIKAMGSKPWVYSSDFPHEVTNAMCAEEIAEIQGNEELTSDDKEALLQRNAERLYRFAPA